ncbi:potassium channel family protein [Algoriphagus hitonicola]|uniref:Trk system potassium uptake protein TrkA n=1 Tax=Algoriphagus hitonicola TaxID=435880 RepID=A0A1I2QC03_9BACT|nr:TrkA family potassium uptake protein [Algoriphagus hitonicola]SFG25450.1 trk system potassium uptake protein TrkA [Algoriphagus hitonicola]
MKYIIVGMGNFGGYLAIQLTEMGHEVVGIDTRESKIDFVKDRVTHAVLLDATDLQAVKTLPVKDTDVVIIAIGEDVGASIMSTAMFKQLNAKRIIGRAINNLHETVLRAIGIEEIIHPEEETADRLAKRLEMKGVIDSLEISDEYNIVEAKVPKRFVGMTVSESNIRSEFFLNIMTIIRMEERKNLIGLAVPHKNVLGVINADYTFKEGDLLLLFGKLKHLQEFLNLSED